MNDNLSEVAFTTSIALYVSLVKFMRPVSHDKYSDEGKVRVEHMILSKNLDPKKLTMY